MVKVWSAVAAATAATAGAHTHRPLECDHWHPRYPSDGHYNTTASISTDKLNVHLIPHTHDDPGWLLTVDQYFTQEVDYILDTVVTELQKDPNRRFMYVEQAFFQRWWREQTKETKQLVKQLVKNGQLDLSANGGWVMHDEATPHYTTMLDQTAFGHKFLLDEFGVIPRIGWQIDPFGHSSTQGSLLSAGIGFDALYFSRIDYQDYEKRKKDNTLEFMWKPSASRNDSVFTGVMQDGYGGPRGFYFDQDAPIKDDPYLHDNNICDRINTFVDQSLARAQHSQGNHIFWPVGEDFKFQNAVKWFKNLDKLIHYTNQEGRVNVFYSTLGNYTDVKLQDKSLQWTTKTDDFFPYADRANGYWSGYFTSRPALKRYIRVANSLLQTLRHLEVWAGKTTTGVHQLAASVGLSLHHDGITGTEKQAVADDYALRLSEGVAAGTARLNDLLRPFSSQPFALCLLTNMSLCNTTDSDPFTFFVYNPLAVARSYTIELPIIAKNAAVELANGTAVPSVVVPFVPVYSQPIANAAPHQLVVQAHVPPLSWLVYHVTFPKASSSEESTKGWDVVTESIMSAENEFVRVEVNSVTGSLVSLTNKATQTKVNVTSSLLYYQAYGKQGDSCSSGAYLFHPNTSAVHNLPSVTSFKCQKTVLLASCVFQFGTWGSLQYKLRAWDHSVVVEWTVGPIPIDDDQGKEVILRFDTSIQSEKTWYTDSNGLEFVKRVRDYRETWNLTLHNEEEKVAANYVPITIATYIRDKSNQFNVITDRAQGAASLKDGSIEIMVHRRLLFDDHKGVGETLNETETVEFANQKKTTTQGLTVRGSIALSVGPVHSAMEFLRVEVHQRHLDALVAVTKLNPQLHLPSNPSVAPRLPRNVGLTSMQIVASTSCLVVRLTHLFAIHEHPVWSTVARVDLNDLLGGHWCTYRVTEVSLSANRIIGHTQNSTLVTLEPMQVRAFQVCEGHNTMNATAVYDPFVTDLAAQDIPIDSDMQAQV